MMRCWSGTHVGDWWVPGLRRTASRCTRARNGGGGAIRYKAANPNHATSMNFWQRLLFAGAFGFFAVILWAAWGGVIG